MGGIVLNESNSYVRYYNENDLLVAIDELEYVQDKTNTSGGLWVAYDQVFDWTRGDRDHVANVALIITDGGSTVDRELTLPYADDLKEDKRVTIFTIGIETPDLNVTELKEMSSDPQIEDQNYFVSPDFDQLSTILNSVVNETCQVVFEPVGNPGKQLWREQVMGFSVSDSASSLPLTSSRSVLSLQNATALILPSCSIDPEVFAIMTPVKTRTQTPVTIGTSFETL